MTCDRCEILQKELAKHLAALARIYNRCLSLEPGDNKKLLVSIKMECEGVLMGTRGRSK